MNYKKMFLCGIVSAGLLLNMGCAQKEEAQKVENNKPTTEISSNENKTSSESTTNIESGYEIARKSIKNENVEVYYPQVNNVNAGQLILDYINQDLENALKNYINEASPQAKLFVDYEVTHLREDVLSVVFKGTQKHEGGQYQILLAKNFDLKTSNSIHTKNLIKADQESKKAMDELIKEAAKNKNLKHELSGLGDWMGVYFTDKDLVFYYLEDDFSTEYVKLAIPQEKAKPYLNTTFGEVPAS